MTSAVVWGWLATVFAGLGYVLYAFSVVKDGGSRPSRMTWFILSAVSCISAWSYFELGASETFGAAVVSALGSTFIAVLSLKYGHGGWETIDKITLLGVLVTCVLWYITGSSLVALLAALPVDCLALMPTIAKVVKWPDTEEFVPWLVTIASNIVNVLALDVMRIHDWTFELAIYPFYMVAINGLILLLIARPRFLRNRSPAEGVD